jgi:hypothetical protein
MKLTSREITEIHLLACYELRGWPKLVRLLHRLYAAHLRLLVFLISLHWRFAR